MRKYLLVLLFPITVNAALLERLGGLAYYDTDADLTWLADANTGGAEHWNDANTWAALLNINGVDDWRLPDTLQPDTSCSSTDGNGGYFGSNCTGSEMGNMFYNVLGGVSGSSISDIHNSNYDLFDNIQSSGAGTGITYWSGTIVSTNINANTAWIFSFEDGQQSVTSTVNQRFIWAVHDGDVSAVPVPAAVWLFGTGLIGLAGLARRKKN